MKMVHIMNYKMLLYTVNLFLAMWALSGVNFDSFMKLNKPFEARLLVLILGLSLSYLTTNFIVDFVP